MNTLNFKLNGQNLNLYLIVFAINLLLGCQKNDGISNAPDKEINNAMKYQVSSEKIINDLGFQLITNSDNTFKLVDKLLQKTYIVSKNGNTYTIIDDKNQFITEYDVIPDNGKYRILMNGVSYTIQYGGKIESDLNYINPQLQRSFGICFKAKWLEYQDMDAISFISTIFFPFHVSAAVAIYCIAFER